MINQTPHLDTAMTKPLALLEQQILNKQQEIEKWFQSEWQKYQPPVYGSVDLRNSGFKLAPVDMNLFPAGFNNLNPEFKEIAIQAARSTIKKINPTAKNILIIPENHTRNPFYWKSMEALVDIFTQAGFMVQVGSLVDIFPEQISVAIKTVSRNGDTLFIDDFIPDVILLNNDLSEGIPSILQNVSQPLVPPAALGWSQRLKSGHFKHYADVAESFAKLVEIDPWFIAPLFKHCGNIDFMQREGEDCVTKNVEKLLAAIQAKYDEYEITDKPFVIIKADAGTYGMAVMTVRDVSEVRSLNRKQRTHMSKSKGGQSVEKIIIQEGVYTFETWGADNAVAEPVVYLLGEDVIGGFYRVHKDRAIDENLNSPGMHFQPLAFGKPCHKPSNGLNACQNRFYAYGVIARLSMLAAAKEIAEHSK